MTYYLMRYLCSSYHLFQSNNILFFLISYSLKDSFLPRFLTKIATLDARVNRKRSPNRRNPFMGSIAFRELSPLLSSAFQHIGEVVAQEVSGVFAFPINKPSLFQSGHHPIDSRPGTGGFQLRSEHLPAAPGEAAGGAKLHQDAGCNLNLAGGDRVGEDLTQKRHHLVFLGRFITHAQNPPLR
jgi:hypothetical protein